MPFAVVGAATAIVAAVWLALDWWRATHATLTFTRTDGPVPPLDLTFYPEQLAFTAPSPPPPLGEARLDGDSLTVGADLVPERARVLYRGAGVGAGVAFVQLGESLPEIELRAPQTLSGRVGEPLGYWCFGWRCDGYRPVPGAEVIVMGGGEHGIELARTRTDADGRFEVDGFDGTLPVLGLRVRAPGFGIAHKSIIDLAAHGGQRALVAVSRVPPRRGRLDLQVDIDPRSLLVLARGLPGVQATPTADGTFELDHVPASD